MNTMKPSLDDCVACKGKGVYDVPCPECDERPKDQECWMCEGTGIMRVLCLCGDQDPDE